MAYSIGFSQALEILFYIELKSRNQEEKYLTIREISNKLNIPIPSVKRLVGLLKKSGFIVSKKGVNGGLSLAILPEDIRIYDVLISIEGRVPMFKQFDDFDTASFVHKSEAEFMLKKSSTIFKEAEDNMLDTLKKYTLADFL